MRDENCCGGNGGGASCTDVRASVVFAACGGVFSSSLRSSSNLTFSVLAIEGVSERDVAGVAPWVGAGFVVRAGPGEEICGDFLLLREGDTPRDKLGSCEVVRIFASLGRGGREERGLAAGEGGGMAASASMIPARSVGFGVAASTGAKSLTAPLSPL